ncbi:MAG TPA: DUF1499 domain-containing protein [Devosia sp.]|nr:DUF1499 domain-containing protein [Devosia sp.]
MRILVRTSKWAIWARRVGALALPLAYIPVLLHRARFITSDNFIVIEAVALALALLAVLMALVAFGRLWFTGDQGWWRASLAFIFGVLCLLPAAYFGYLAWRQPDSPDVSTDYANPLPLVSAVDQAFMTPAERARIETEFPNARSRNYPITAPDMFDAVAALVDDRDWDVRSSRRPTGPLDSGQINAIVTTLLGFRQEVVIRVTGAADGATVAMRSASLSKVPDFGENGTRIETFLLDLDNQVTQMLRDASPAGQSDN